MQQPRNATAAPAVADSLTFAAPLLQTKADAMVKHLASLADQRLIISFAPKTLAYTILKRIGELFPGPSKVRQHMHGLLHMYRLPLLCIWH